MTYTYYIMGYRSFDGKLIDAGFSNEEPSLVWQRETRHFLTYIQKEDDGRYSLHFCVHKDKDAMPVTLFVYSYPELQNAINRAEERAVALSMEIIGMVEDFLPKDEDRTTDVKA